MWGPSLFENHKYDFTEKKRNKVSKCIRDKGACFDGGRLRIRQISLLKNGGSSFSQLSRSPHAAIFGILFLKMFKQQRGFQVITVVFILKH